MTQLYYCLAMPKRLDILLYKYLFINFHYCPIHNVREWKEPKCLLTDYMHMVYICCEYYSAVKKNEVRIWRYMDGPRKDHIVWRNTDPGRQMLLVLSHLWFLTPNSETWIQHGVTTETRKAQRDQEGCA